nr:MAG TPA: hypothetical protein [Caudoviricetes sp.]
MFYASLSLQLYSNIGCIRNYEQSVNNWLHLMYTLST